MCGISQHVGQKEIGVKTGGKEKTRITAVLAVDANGGKLPALLIFKGKPTPPGKTPAAQSIEREFKTYKDKKGNTYPRGVVYAVDPKAWHTQRMFNEVWVPQVWNQRPGRGGRAEGVFESYRQPDTLLAWDDYTVHKTDVSKEAMAKSNTTTLFLIPGGLTPKLQPCDGLVNKLFKLNMSRLYDDHMASPGLTRDSRGYPEPPSRGLLAQWVKKAWGAVDANSIRSRWKKAGLLLAVDGSGDAAWAKKELNSDAQGRPLDADVAVAPGGAEEVDPGSISSIFEVLEIEDDDDTAGGGDDDDDSDVEEVAWGGLGLPATNVVVVD